jgi:thiol-disulfide isomerase/thioredoxin|tara:strand:- start:128 stop:499 length:372 start_codon:yes stop_codon:yes gene_type:complete
MKKIFILIFTLISLNCFAVEKSTTFTKEIFDKAQSEGKIVVINSWNKFCTTCKKQVNILDQAEKEFNDVLFLSFEQNKNKKIGDFLKINYWTTIVIYKNNKEIYRSIGNTDRSEIYFAIEKSV